MSKFKSQKKTIPVSIPTTKHKYEQLFTPYKIQWNTQKLIDTHKHDFDIHKQNQEQTNENSKTFFNAMKNQLINIKNDVEKLIQKESVKKNENEESKKSMKEEKKCWTAEKKFPEKENKHSSSKKIILPKSQLKQPIQKRNIICKVEKVQKKGETADESNIKTDRQSQQQQKIINDLKALNSNYINEIKLQKSLISQLQKQNKNLYQKLTNKHSQKQYEQLTNQLQIAQKKSNAQNTQILELQEQIDNFNEVLQEKQTEIETLKLNQESEEENYKIKITEMTAEFERRLKQMQKQNCEYVDKFGGKLAELEMVIQKYVQEIEEITAENNKWKNRCAELENRLEESQKTHQSDHRLIELSKEFERKITESIEENILLKKKVNELNAEIDRIQVEKLYLKETILVYQKCSETYSNENPKQLQDLHEQYKEQLSGKEQQIQQLEFKVMALQNTIDAYKSSDSNLKESDVSLFSSNITSGTSMSHNNSSLNTNEIFNKALKQQLQQNQHYKEQVKQMKSQIYKTTQSLKELRQINIDLSLQNKRKKEQIQKLRKTSEENKKARHQDIDIQMLQNDIQIGKKKQQTLQILLDSKQQQIKKKDEFIKNLLKTEPQKISEQP